MKKRQIIFLLLTILWMCVIFVMSGHEGDESTEDSFNVGMLIGKIFVPDFDEYSEEEKHEFVEAVNYPVRKLAHATEYAVLAALISGILLEDRRQRCNGILAWLLATLYAGTDELHQIFVPGRDGNMIDVCIDSGGAFVGMIFACFVFLLAKKKESEHSLDCERNRLAGKEGR